MRRAAALVCACLILPAAPAAAQDIGQTVQDGLVEQSCRALAASTVGVPDLVKADPVIGIPTSWPIATGLPGRVELRTDTQTFNRLFEFAIREGHMYARQRGGSEWRTVPSPPASRAV